MKHYVRSPQLGPGNGTGAELSAPRFLTVSGDGIRFLALHEDRRSRAAEVFAKLEDMNQDTRSTCSIKLTVCHLHSKNDSTVRLDASPSHSLHSVREAGEQADP